MKLRNEQAGMEIGITAFGIYHEPALYIQEGREQRILATFLSWEKAKLFLQKLEQWDRAGGAD